MKDEQLIELRYEFEHYRERLELLSDMVEKNTQAVERIAHAVERQAESTADIVQLYADLRGAARVGVGLQRLLTRLIALGALGAAVAGLVTYAVDKFIPT